MTLTLNRAGGVVVSVFVVVGLIAGADKDRMALVRLARAADAFPAPWVLLSWR